MLLVFTRIKLIFQAFLVIEVHALALPHFDHWHYSLISFLGLFILEYRLLKLNQLGIAHVFEVFVKLAETYCAQVFFVKVHFFIAISDLSLYTQF
jgi:hypothetical protein